MATETGRRAESLAAEFLQRRGFKILAQNWRTRWCEIDLVAERAGVTHIIEVKYRANPSHGSGFDYITPTKLHQLIRAAEFYQHDTGQRGPIQIDAVEMIGNLSAPAIELIENVTN